MSRFMFVMFEGGGNVPPQLAIAKRLVARGHHVHVLGDPSIESQATGCTFTAFATAPHHNFRRREHDRVQDWSVTNPLSQLRRVADELMFGPAEHYARDVLRELERHPVDTLAIDCLLYGAFAGAERAGVPTVQLHHMPYSIPTRGLPPFGMGLAPATGPLGRLRDRILTGAVTQMFERFGRARLNAARAALGLPPLASVFDQVRDRQDRVLVLTAPSFDFASRVALPANVAYVGPQLDDPAWSDSTVPASADVVVALGSTYQNQGALTQRVIDALADLPVRGLVTLGGVFAPNDFTVPSNVVAVASAPHNLVLPAAKVVVAHGGHGTVMKSLAHAKPLLCIPLGRDQADNATRVVTAGAGLRAKPSASVSQLRRSIRRLLDETQFAANARAMKIVATEDRAVRELEAVASPVLSALAVLCCVLFASPGCGDDTMGTRTDAAIDTPSALAPTINDVQCGPLPPTGPGNIAEFQKHVLDPATFPDALCNDGTPAKFYFRPYNGAANRNKWMLNLHGGGVCGSGKSCISRWCGCNNTSECPYAEVTTNFTRLTMTNAGPAQKSADGVFYRGGTGAETNPYGDYNQVEFSYCTSDAWRGRARDIALSAIHPKTGEPVDFTLHFLGASVLDANIATLRDASLVYTLNGASTAMPDLDEATEIIVTGDSAGGAGTIANLDYLATTLRATNTGSVEIVGLLDAIVGPEMAALDFGAYSDPQVRTYDQYLTRNAAGATAIDARVDASCLATHAADPQRCHDDTHVLRHHMTTPFFVRMALRDMLISENYIESGLRNADMSPMTVASFALNLHADLSTFDAMLSTAEEKAAMTVAPGVFAPGCTKHDTIHVNADTYHSTITPPGGSPTRLFQVFYNWRTGGTPTSLLTQSMTLSDTVCP